MPYIASESSLLSPSAVLVHLRLGAGMRVADLGCGGHGQFTLHAARLVGPRGLVYAVDILKSTLAELAKKARLEGCSNVKPIWSNLEVVGATAIPAGSLDAALLVNVLFQSRDRASLLQEAGRLLRTGSQLLVVDWQLGASPLGPPQEQRLTPAQVKANAQAAGFQLSEEFSAGRYHYGLVFTK